MLATLEGPMGSGKSLTACSLAYRDHTVKGKRVVTNNAYNFEHTKFDREYFVEHIADQELTNCTLVLDEAYLFVDARTSAAKLNKLFTYFIAQTRKRGVTLYICTHHLTDLDRRLRMKVDIRGICRYYAEATCNGCKGTGYKGPVVKCRNCEVNPESGKGEISPGILCGSCNGSSNAPANAGTVKCLRCHGFGATGWAVTRFFNRKTGKSVPVTVNASAFWDKYDTEELVAFSKSQVKIKRDDLE